jgi:hypothetical protein
MQPEKRQHVARLKNTSAQSDRAHKNKSEYLEIDHGSVTWEYPLHPPPANKCHQGHGTRDRHFYQGD